MSEVIEIKFLGQVYAFKCDESDINATDVVDYVEKSMAEAEKNYPGLPPGKLVVLAALNMGKDYIELKKKIEEMGVTIKKQCELIDASLFSSLNKND